VQAIYVPADDDTDPAPATTFAHLDASTNLSRPIAELGIGEVTVTVGGQEHRFMVNGGFVQVGPDRVTLMANEAERGGPHSLDSQTASLRWTPCC